MPVVITEFSISGGMKAKRRLVIYGIDLWCIIVVVVYVFYQLGNL